ncbi:hypothetical protein AUI46_03980 [archaeon 13_1_40CM_2_52_13]|nr:MAG: hypothetical protein AUI46_03980 [archaeon 13_1_40CM_2_52_13]
MIADTSFIIDLMQNDPGAVTKAKSLEKAGSAISLSSPSIFELYVGVTLSVRKEEERSRVLAVLSGLSLYSLDSESAILAGVIYGQKITRGRHADPIDSLIAGIAKRSGETVLTRNAKDFAGIEGLKTETY